MYRVLRGISVSVSFKDSFTASVEFPFWVTQGCLWVTVKLLITGANHLRRSQGEGLRFLSSPTRGFSIRVLDFMSLPFWDLGLKGFMGFTGFLSGSSEGGDVEGFTGGLWLRVLWGGV